MYHILKSMTLLSPNEISVYRAGIRTPFEDIRNINAERFDDLSQEWFIDSNHFPRCETVFMSLDYAQAIMWAERRSFKGRDSSVWKVTIPSSVLVYNFSFYNRAMWAMDSINPEDDVQQCVDSYWSSGIEISSWYENFNDPSDWEIKVPYDIAEKARWQLMNKKIDTLSFS